MLIKIVGYLLLMLASLPLHALVHVEGIIMGETKEDLQSDPLTFIFRDIYDRSKLGENKKLKLYHSTFVSGTYLTESCGLYGPMSYANSWQETQARRSVAATLQYIGLDTTIKVIGAYARRLEIGADDFKRLSSNLVQNYCSKNITIFSLRNIERSLQHYYDNPLKELIPSVESSPFATEDYKHRTERDEARSIEMNYAIKNFKSFCSWGGQVDDYRLMGPYLKNSFIMAFVVKNLLGIQDKLEEKLEKVVTTRSKSTVQVGCDELICRKTSSWEEFERKFPLSIGSSGINTDLGKLYCNHFRYQDYTASSSVPQVKKWIKEAELEDPIFETSFFLSLMTGVPDAMFSTEKYLDLPFVARSSIDERWNNWAKDVLSVFSKDLLFEESIKVRPLANRSLTALQTEGFRMRFTVTVGEMDRIMDENDKLKTTLNLKFSKNYLRQVKSKWRVLVNEADFEGQKNFKKDMGSYIGLQMKSKEKFFLQRMWTPDFNRLLAEELLEQVLAYKGSLFDSYKDEVLTVPVELNYGLFALSYLRFRADVNADRLKFKF